MSCSHIDHDYGDFNFFTWNMLGQWKHLECFNLPLDRFTSVMQMKKKILTKESVLPFAALVKRHLSQNDIFFTLQNNPGIIDLAAMADLDCLLLFRRETSSYSIEILHKTDLDFMVYVIIADLLWYLDNFLFSLQISCREEYKVKFHQPIRVSYSKAMEGQMFSLSEQLRPAKTSAA